MNKLKAVIFDMDGVLIDTEELYIEHRIEYLKKMGYEIGSDFIKPLRGNHNRGYWEAIIQHLKLPHPIDDLIKDSREDYVKFLKSKKIQLSPGVKKLITTLHSKGIKLAVASSGNPKRIEMVLEITDIRKNFDVVVSGDDILNPKPAPDAYQKSAKLLGINPENCIAIEDTTMGVRSAKSAGMKVIGYLGSIDNTQDLSEADLVIKSFSEINLQKLQEIVS